MAEPVVEPSRHDEYMIRSRRAAVGFESSESVGHRLSFEPVSVRALVLRFALAGLVATILVAVVTAFASVSVGTDLAINDARRSTWVTAVGIIEPALDDGILQQDSDSLERLDSAVRENVLRGSLVRVKVWGPDGKILYSDEPRLIGATFSLDKHEAALFTAPAGSVGPEAEVSDLTSPENVFETEGKLLEVYIPVRTKQGTTLLYEAYFEYSGVTDVGRDLWRRFAPLAIGGLLVLELIQIPFAWRMARRLRSGQEQRELLLRHAIDSSETERRRIASDLHDGVVQDLTGVSLSLAAASRTGTTDPRLADASTAIRESVKSLRSLLVEIYPPNLHEEGLESALGDLLGRLTNRGLRTELTVEPAVSTLHAGSTALLYRAAQEALRNVATHSGATKVTVTVAVVGSDVQLIVDDDGRGLDLDRLAAQQRGGHVGLKSLAGLVQDARGELVVRSAPGAGTSVQVILPNTKGKP
jgi:two-component system, NarL family, sensor kinase